jgi:hypothetical protein
LDDADAAPVNPNRKAGGGAAGLVSQNRKFFMAGEA